MTKLAWLPLLALAGAAGVSLAARRKAARATKKFAPSGRFVHCRGAKLHYIEAGRDRDGGNASGSSGNASNASGSSDGVNESGNASSCPPLVLLHGNDGSLIDFKMSMFDLLASEFHTIAFDRPGHGHSVLAYGACASVEMQAAMIHDALRQIGAEKPIVLGHSWGGMLALQYALDYPDNVSGLVLVSSVSHPSKREKVPLTVRLLQKPVLSQILMPLCVLGSRAEVESQLRKAFHPASPPPAYMDAFCSLLLRHGQIRALCNDELAQHKSLQQLAPLYKQIGVPSFIITGDQDLLVRPERNSYLLHQILPDARLQIIEGGGHELQFTHPQEIMKAVRHVAEREKPRMIKPDMVL